MLFNAPLTLGGGAPWQQAQTMIDTSTAIFFLDTHPSRHLEYHHLVRQRWTARTAFHTTA